MWTRSRARSTPRLPENLRSRSFWIVAGLTAAAAALRFATLGTQAYHHDEIVTASRVLRGDFFHAMEAVGFSESAPPLYYALAWAWTQLTGTGEAGLRSLSALAGVATVPVAYLLGAELRGRRAGLLAAALVAVNPMLLWYSQEARGYALLVLLTALAALFFVRALRSPADVPQVEDPYGPRSRGTSGRLDVVMWGVFSALALATHYFAVFPVALEAAWLLWRRRRAALSGVSIVALAGLALAPLAIHQMSLGHAEWIGDRSLGHRLWEVGVTFVVGETGDIVSRPETVLPAIVPLLAALAALALLGLRGDRDERRAGGLVLVVAAATVAVPLALAVLAPGKDYVIARNLIPALVPLLVAVAIGLTLRRARRRGDQHQPAGRAPARLGGGRGAPRRAGKAARDGALDAGRRLPALVPLDRLFSGPALRRLLLERARGRLRLRRPGAARSAGVARAALSPARALPGRSPARDPLRAARPGPGAPAPAARAQSGARVRL